MSIRCTHCGGHEGFHWPGCHTTSCRTEGSVEYAEPVLVPKPAARPTWDEYGLEIALAVALRADCRRRQVGAVILDRQHRVTAAGYNGAPPGWVGCIEGGCPRATSDVPAYSDYANCISCHAEVNALLYADRSRIEGGTLYLTDPPCFACRKVIANSGLAEVVWPGRKVTVSELLEVPG